MSREPQMVCINGRIYHESAEVANVMHPNFIEVAKVKLANGERAVLYQCATTGRLASARALISADGPLAVFLVKPQVH